MVPLSLANLLCSFFRPVTYIITALVIYTSFSLRKFVQEMAKVQGGSVAEWLACRTQARKSTGSNRSRGAVE